MTEETSAKAQNHDALFWRVLSWVLIGVFVALLGHELSGLFRRSLQNTQSGEKAPDFSVVRIDESALPGEKFVLSAQRGHPVLLDFWATWCGPCKESLPLINEVHKRLGPRGLRTIAVEIEGAEAKARRFAGALKLTMPLGSDAEKVAELYGVTQIPLTVLIDREGRIRRVFRGVHSAEELTQEVLAIGLDR